LLSRSNLETSFENKFGIKLEMGDITWGLDKIKLEDVRTFMGENINFYSSEITLIPDYKKSIRNFFSSRELIVFFKEIELLNISIYMPFTNLSDNSCDFPLNITYPEAFNKENKISLSKERLSIKEPKIFIPNKMFLSMENEEFDLLLNNKSYNSRINLDLVLGRYVSGEVSLNDLSENERYKQKCLILPAEPKNNVFY
jgi:hypothetical protein